MELLKSCLLWLCGSWLDSLMSNEVLTLIDASALAGASLLILLCTAPPKSQWVNTYCNIYVVETQKEAPSSMKPLTIIKLVRLFIRSGWYRPAESKNYRGGAGEASVHSPTHCDHIHLISPGNQTKDLFSVHAIEQPFPPGEIIQTISQRQVLDTHTVLTMLSQCSIHQLQALN